MHAGSLGGPDTIDACAKAALAHSANAAVHAARSTWIPESMLSPSCWIEPTDCRRTRLVVNCRHGVRDAGNLADMRKRNWTGLAESAERPHQRRPSKRNGGHA